MVLMNPELSIFASENDANTPIILHGDSSENENDDANNPSTRTRNRNSNPSASNNRPRPNIFSLIQNAIPSTPSISSRFRFGVNVPEKQNFNPLSSFPLTRFYYHSAEQCLDSNLYCGICYNIFYGPCLVKCAQCDAKLCINCAQNDDILVVPGTGFPLVTCPYCNQVACFEKVNQIILGFIENIPIKCIHFDNGCKKILRLDTSLFTHEQTCDYELLKCKFHPDGCRTTYLRKDSRLMVEHHNICPFRRIRALESAIRMQKINHRRRVNFLSIRMSRLERVYRRGNSPPNYEDISDAEISE